MEKVEEIRNRITRKPADLVMSRVPKHTLNRFNALCNIDDFCNDRGMVLKYLMDLHDGIIVTGIEHLEQEISGLKYELSQLKGVEETPTKKRLDGSPIKNR